MTDLRLENVSHTYDGHEAVRGVSFDVASGELICLLGPSGCGKTTLLRLIAGLENLQQGRVLIGGNPIADAAAGLYVPPERRGVGLMFQDFALFPHLTIIENVTFGLPRGATEQRSWGRQILDRMGLGRTANNYPHTLSGGQQQRVALLRALAPSPNLLLLDEPFSDLDANSRTQVREETLNLLRETVVTTLMVTHDPEEAMFMADRILIMRNGAIVQAGSPGDIYSHPQSAFVAGLFGPVNKLYGMVENGRVNTTLGSFDAPGIAHGSPVRILIRPEAVHLAPADTNAADDVLARVVSVRLLGRASVVRICCCAAGGEEVNLQARVPNRFPLVEDTNVSVRIDPSQAFVFSDR